MDEELEAALAVENKATLEEASTAHVEVSIEMPTGEIQYLPPPPSKQAKLMRSLFREAFQHSQRVEINGLLDVGYSAPVDENDIPDGRKGVASKWVHTYQGGDEG